MLRFHLSQNNGSVCLHSEYPNWTVRRSVNLNGTDNLRFFTHKVDLSLNPVIVSDNAQTRSDLGLHYLFVSFSSNI